VLFRLGLIIRTFSRLLVGSYGDEGSTDLEILVLRQADHPHANSWRTLRGLARQP